MVAATGLLVPVSWTPAFLDLTGTPYLATATVLGLGFLGAALSAARDMTETRARKVFFASLLYHPLLLSVMLFDTIRI